LVSRITHLKLNGEEKLEVFLCIDIHTNLAISYLGTRVVSALKSTSFRKVLKNVLL